MRWTLAGLAMAVFSCSKDGPVANSIEGTVTVPSRGHSASIFWDTAVAYDDGSTFLAYFTGAEGASCSTIAEFLGPNDGPTRKDKVLQGGSCTLMIKIEDWSGESIATRSASDTEYSHPGASSVLHCNFGDGEDWVRETRNEEYEDYYWSGDYFLGIPQVYSWDIAGDASGSDLQLSFSQFDGNIQEESPERLSASADIQGEITASWCGDLATAEVL